MMLDCRGWGLGENVHRSQNCPQDKTDQFWCVKHKIKLFDTVFKPKCCPNWCKTVLFFQVSEPKEGGGGITYLALIQKRDGEIGKFFAGWESHIKKTCIWSGIIPILLNWGTSSSKCKALHLFYNYFKFTLKMGLHMWYSHKTGTSGILIWCQNQVHTPTFWDKTICV